MFVNCENLSKFATQKRARLKIKCLHLEKSVKTLRKISVYTDVFTYVRTVYFSPKLINYYKFMSVSTIEYTITDKLRNFRKAIY
ncbi:MAG: hypothetical protein FD188_3584, partial [Ignavibacteria bacterium]